MKSKPQPSGVFQFSLKTLICLVLLAAFYLAGRESQQSTIRKQNKQIDKLVDEVDRIQSARVTHAQQIATILAYNRQLNEQVKQTRDALQSHALETGIENPAEHSGDIFQQLKQQVKNEQKE